MFIHIRVLISKDTLFLTKNTIHEIAVFQIKTSYVLKKIIDFIAVKSSEKF